MSTFANIPIEKIHAHPGNIRFAAVADEEMVDSIRALGIHDPVLVAPHPDLPGEYRLIDGHRRMDGARQAGLTQVEARIREDLVTEAQQIEVMVSTAVHREDLTPVEEAAAYEQLTFHGMDAKAIAAATGRSLATVKARLKLTSLPESTRGHLHEGQLTLGDAESMLEFADQPDVLAKLEAAAGAGNLRYEVSRARQEREMHQRREAVAKEISDGISFERLEFEGTFPSWDTETGPCTVEKTGLPEAASHIECGRMFWPQSLWQSPFLVCINPGRHPKPKDSAGNDSDKAQAERDAKWEAERAAREEERLRQAAAARVRLAHLMTHFTGALTVKATPKPLVAALPFLLVDTLGQNSIDFRDYAIALGLEVDTTGSIEHCNEIPGMAPAKLLKSYAAVLATQAEGVLSYAEGDDAAFAWDWMLSTGYEPSDVDQQLIAQARGAEDDEDAA